MHQTTTDHAFMGQVLNHCEAALQRSDCPVAAIVVRDGQVVGGGCNQVATTGDATAHAEIQAILDACARLGSARHAGMRRPDYGDYAVEKPLSLTRASLELTPDVRTPECETMRRRWPRWVEPPLA